MRITAVSRIIPTVVYGEFLQPAQMNVLIVLKRYFHKNVNNHLQDHVILKTKTQLTYSEIS
jgi:hypothetical protein